MSAAPVHAPFGPGFRGAVPPALDVPAAQPDAQEAAFVWRAMALFAFEDCDWLFWRFTDGRMRVYVNCNDVFHWGCADGEELTPHNIADAAQAKADAQAATGSTPYNWPLLFCARQRQMRPQGAMYKHLDPKLWPLFDAAGPERPVEFGNPVAHPTADQAGAARTEQPGEVGPE